MPELKYNKAIKRIEDIIEKIENETFDVDELSEKVREAVGLIKVCKNKIEKAELDVKKVVEDMDTPLKEE